MATEVDVVEASNEFRDLLARCGELAFHIHDVAEFPDRRALMEQPWAKQAGAYALMYGAHVRYVGRALKGQGLGRRLWEHFRTNQKFRENIEGGDPPRIAVLALADHDAWLAPSLELLLHWRTRSSGDLWNKKRC